MAGRLESKTFIETPLPSLTVMFFLAGGMSILLGIQSELIMRTYYESQAKTTYLLREVRQKQSEESRDRIPLMACSRERIHGPRVTPVQQLLRCAAA